MRRQILGGWRSSASAAETSAAVEEYDALLSIALQQSAAGSKPGGFN